MSRSGVDLIITADWHLRETVPVCRTDDFYTAQWNKVDQIAELQRTYECPVIHAGDLFDNWKPSPALLTDTIKHLPKKFYTVCGNHDLPQHSLDLINKCGVRTVEAAGALTILKEGHFGQPLAEIPSSITGLDVKIGINHVFTWTGTVPWAGCQADSAMKIVRNNQDYSLIITGDNHQTFIIAHKDTQLVNPGCLTRQTIAYEKHKPCVFFWSEELMKLTRHVLQYDRDVIQKEHLEQEEQKQNRIDAYIEHLQNVDIETTVDFEENIKQFLLSNKVSDRVKNLVYASLDA